MNVPMHVINNLPLVYSSSVESHMTKLASNFSCCLCLLSCNIVYLHCVYNSNEVWKTGEKATAESLFFNEYGL